MRTAARPGAAASAPLVTLLLGLLLPVLLQAPAAASSTEATGDFCPEDEGVSVVVDPGELGGEVRRACVPVEGEQVAADVFEDAGVELTPVGAFPGAACRVEGEPAEAACEAMPPADAYWGLFVADPGAEWEFASSGADELTLGAGDFVGFAWQSGGDTAPPGVTAEPVASGTEPANGFEEEGAEEGSEDGSGEGAGDAVAQEEPESGTGVPVWLPVVGGLLLVAGAAWILVRRRSSGG